MITRSTDFGDIIYDGIYDAENSLADKQGFRNDVCEAIKASGASTLRYPGGNFVSNYHWEDGIGPKELRPKVFDYAWLTDDDNRMGTVEFIELCRKVRAEPYICVNMGSGTAEEAMHWVEFCNGTGDSKYVNMRRSLGYDEPFNVKYWGLGNEMYGDWQFASCDAQSYAAKLLYSENLSDFNSFDNKECVVTKNVDINTVDGVLNLRKHSLTVIKLPLAE